MGSFKCKGTEMSLDTSILGNGEAGACATHQGVERPETRKVVGGPRSRPL